jgi:DNA-binding transcriptional MerR regulator
VPVEIRTVDNVWEIRKLAEHIGLPYTTLHGQIRRGAFPPPTHVLGGGLRRYYTEEEARALAIRYRTQARG